MILTLLLTVFAPAEYITWLCFENIYSPDYTAGYKKQNLTNLGYNKVSQIYLSPKYQCKFLYSV